ITITSVAKNVPTRLSATYQKLAQRNCDCAASWWFSNCALIASNLVLAISRRCWTDNTTLFAACDCRLASTYARVVSGARLLGVEFASSGYVLRNDCTAASCF